INREDDEEVRTELRQLIDRAALIPLEGPGQFQLEVHDSLAALLALDQAQRTESPEAYAIGAL
ncbi:hypothetical protein Q6300_28485, partial [Klebsiella pneumoniae]|nr:hypothetical protein [Klebsiella pneumoniae]